MESFRADASYRDYASTADDTVVPEDEYLDTESSLSAFAFVAVWDPEDDVVFFSPKEYIASSKDSLSTIRPHYPKPSISDLQSLYFPAVSASSSSRSSVCYQTLRDRHDTLFSTFDREQRPARGMSQTSSTLGGLDVYLKGATLALTHRHQPVYSVLDFETGFDLKTHPYSSNDNLSGGGYFSRLDKLNINAYLENGPTDRCSLSWSAIESPSAEEVAESKKSMKSAKSHPGRRLKKRRPSDTRPPTPASEAKTVGTSPNASHSLCETLTPKHLLGALGFGRLKQRIAEHDWVFVEG